MRDLGQLRFHRDCESQTQELVDDFVDLEDSQDFVEKIEDLNYNWLQKLLYIFLSLKGIRDTILRQVIEDILF